MIASLEDDKAENIITIDLEGGPEFDPLDTACLSRLETEGRDVAVRLMDFLRREIEGFAASYIAAWPARAGVRETTASSTPWPAQRTSSDCRAR